MKHSWWVALATVAGVAWYFHKKEQDKLLAEFEFSDIQPEEIEVTVDG